MNKFWIFVEGDSEEEFVKNLLYSKYSDRIILCRDFSEFVKTEINDADFALAIIENCNSIDKIPHRINEIYYLIEQSGSNKILIIGDLERLPCFTARKELFLNILDSNVPTDNIRMVFSNPIIEAHYWECPDLISRIIVLEYREIFKTNVTPTITIPHDIDHGIYGLKQLFKMHQLKYRESRFSEKFFPRLDFECQNNALTRTKNIIEGFIQ
jgi:hypothetical protein